MQSRKMHHFAKARCKLIISQSVNQCGYGLYNPIMHSFLLVNSVQVPSSKVKKHSNYVVLAVLKDFMKSFLLPCIA